jgi:hypothetical protein
VKDLGLSVIGASLEDTSQGTSAVPDMLQHSVVFKKNL